MKYTKQTQQSSPYSLSFAFTLVELIVVVTILAILATIGFVSYSSYLTGVRDTNRLAQLVSIHDGLELYRTRNDLPLPDESVDVIIGVDPIAYQGFAGSNTLETIDFTKGGLDPRDKSYFSYYLTADRKYFQLMAFLEEEANITTQNTIRPHPNPLLGRRGDNKNSPSSSEGEGAGGGGLFIQQTHAVDYSARIPTIYGKKLGILTNAENTPIQEIQTIKDDGELDISSTEDTSGYIAHLSDVSMIEGTANNSPLQYLDNIAKTGGSITKSCKQLLEKIPSIKGKDGAYMIDPSGLSPELIHCDMTTNGGGRTYATMLADGTTKNLFNTGNTEKITSITNNISTKGSISSVWKENVYKDIMIVCQITTSSLMSYETPLFIYQYGYGDIINLEKQNKQGSIFSSKDLDGSWGNYNFTYNSSYGGSAEETTLYLYANGPTPNVVFNSYNGTAVLKTPSGDAQGPANNSVNLSQPFSSTNYCMTAIR